MVKYADNAWHAVKVAFANEIGNIAKASGVDSWEVMDIFCQDRKLNISPCLPPARLRLRRLLPAQGRAGARPTRAASSTSTCRSSNALIPTNARQIDRALEMIAARGERRIAVLGISFKAGTDDLRESPQVALVERLIGKGYEPRRSTTATCTSRGWSAPTAPTSSR